MVSTLSYGGREEQGIKDVKKEIENKTDFFIWGCNKFFNT